MHLVGILGMRDVIRHGDGVANEEDAARTRKARSKRAREQVTCPSNFILATLCCPSDLRMPLTECHSLSRR